jgi:hypothetical protein
MLIPEKNNFWGIMELPPSGFVIWIMPNNYNIKI